MTTDPNTQRERQLWAAYRLILSWPKREAAQNKVRQAVRTDDSQVEDKACAEVVLTHVGGE